MRNLCSSAGLGAIVSENSISLDLPNDPPRTMFAQCRHSEAGVTEHPNKGSSYLNVSV
jgi:hypothetical protein